VSPGDFLVSLPKTQQLAERAMRKSVLIAADLWHDLAAEDELSKITLRGSTDNVA
jgi:hypothetical protein